ncbi:hypothetical protein B0T13DRAFT_253216 [Neurospora crassa]|nr:hypothetical protein B0T13DRAFT_253216 [Neurospora crassa]
MVFSHPGLSVPHTGTPPSRLHIHTSTNTIGPTRRLFRPNTVSHPCHPMSRHPEPRAETKREEEETTRGRERERALTAVSGGLSGCDLTPPHVVAPHKATQRSATLAKPVLSPMTPFSARSSSPLTNGRLGGGHTHSAAYIPLLNCLTTWLPSTPGYSYLHEEDGGGGPSWLSAGCRWRPVDDQYPTLPPHLIGLEAKRSSIYVRQEHAKS